MKNKIYKALSILLSLIIVFSACYCVFTTVSAATEKTYFVSSTGDDANNGLTQRYAIATIAKGIELGKEAGLGAGDTVTLKVLNTTAVAWSSATSNPIYLPTHDFKLIITSNSDEGTAIAGTGDRNVNFGGDVDFKNIKVNFGSNYNHICSHGHNITFDQNCTFQGNTQMGYYSLGAWSGNHNYTDDFTFTTQMPIGVINMGNFYSHTIFNSKVTVNYNALSGAPSFSFGSSDTSNDYNKPVSITVNAASVKFAVRSNGINLGNDAYIQILNNTSSSFTATDAFVTAIPDGKLWILNNKLRAGDMLTLTDTKGKFAVNTAVYSNVKAVDVSDPNNVINEDGGYLTLPAGVYDITAEKIPQTVTYYVEADGTGDGKTEDTPVGSVAAAIKQAVSDGYIVNDQVNVMVMGETVPLGSIAAYPFNLTIDSNDPATRTRIDASNEGNLAMGQGALTTFKNVEIYKTGQYSVLRLNSSDVTFESTCKFNTSYLAIAYGSSNGDNNQNGTIPGQTVIMNNVPTYQTYLTNWLYSNRTYNKPVTYIMNNPDATTEICLNSWSEGSTNGDVYYNSAVNIGILSAKNFKLRNADGAHFENSEGLQIINGSPVELKKDHSELAKIPSDKVYVLNNVSGDSKLLEFTDTVGKFKVNLVNQEHDVVFEKDGVKTYYDKSGFITLEPGVYSVSIERDPIFVDYYVNPEGIEVLPNTRPEGAGTKNNPVRTFADATRLISQDGLSKIDVATVHFQEGVRNYWKNENANDQTYNLGTANYNCTVVLDSNMEGSVSELYSYGALSLTGPLVMRNIDFTMGYQYGEFCLSDYDFTLEETASLSAPYVHTWKTEYGKVHDADMTVTIKGAFTTNYIGLSAPYHDHKSTGDFNFYIDNPNAAASFVFGPKRNGNKNVYEGNINITVKQAKSLSLGMSEMGEGGEITGSLQLLIDDSVALPYAVKTNFENFEVAGGKWYITNAATDDDFVTFTDKGILTVKNGATAYSRQYGKDLVKHTGGTIDFSQASGAYTVSDKTIAPLKDDSHKMLYFLNGATSKHLGTRAKVTPGETYVFEYSIYNSFYEDCKPSVRDDGDRGHTCDVEIISEKKVGDYYKIKCKATIPEDYDAGSTAFFCVDLNAYSEGIIFDRTVYNINDPDKKDCFEGNQNFHSGLDYVSLHFEFWGAIFTDSRGGKGLVKWQSGLYHLEVMDFDLEKIAEIKKLNNPDDGKWWKDKDIKEEQEFSGEATVKGTFKYQDGTPIPGHDMLLVSDDDSFTKTTDSNGKFSFTGLSPAYYELFVVEGDEKIPTGFASYLFDGDVVTFDVINDITGISIDNPSDQDNSYNNYGGSYYGTDTDYTSPEEQAEQAIPSGNLTGTVYTPALETVPNLKIVLRGVGEVVTDENGQFGFADIPVGEYELYAINSDGSEFVFKTYSIKEGVNLDVKLKYSPSIDGSADNGDTGWIIWVIVASVVALLVVGTLVVLLVVLKKRKIEQA